MSSATVRLLSRAEIDTTQWDRCVAAAENGTIYARSWYLDCIAHHWSGIIIGEYEAVFPLPWNRKYGISYVYPPPFSQQLGLISADVQLETYLPDVLALAKKHFRFGEYLLNYRNNGGKDKNNFILHLVGHAEMKKNYSSALRYDLRKAESSKVNYQETKDPTELIALYRRLYGDKLANVTSDTYRSLKELCSKAAERGQLVIREMRTNEGALSGGLICMKDDRRLYLILSAVKEEGRRNKCNHLVTDRLIQEFAGTGLILDFEGSDIEGIAHFYKSFGAINQPYSFIKWNQLPWPISLLKR
jgi:hypothetical protein